MFDFYELSKIFYFTDRPCEINKIINCILENHMRHKELKFILGRKLSSSLFTEHLEILFKKIINTNQHESLATAHIQLAEGYALIAQLLAVFESLSITLSKYLNIFFANNDNKESIINALLYWQKFTSVQLNEKAIYHAYFALNNFPNERLGRYFYVKNNRNRQLFGKVSVKSAQILLSIKTMKISEKLPIFKAIDDIGKLQTNENLKGSITVLYIWSSTCPPCIDSLPKLVNLNHEMKNQPFNLLTFNVDPDKTQFNHFWNKYRLKIPTCYIGFKPDILSLFGIKSFPSYLILDQNCNVVFKDSGSICLIRFIVERLAELIAIEESI